MIYLVEVAYTPKTAPNSRQVESVRVDATDPDQACVAVRDVFRIRLAPGKHTFAIRHIKEIPDYIVRVDASIALFYPQTDEAREWLEDHVDEEAQWLGNALAVEHRYAQSLMESLQVDGFTVGI